MAGVQSEQRELGVTRGRTAYGRSTRRQDHKEEPGRSRRGGF